jgi:hypothetical protein
VVEGYGYEKILLVRKAELRRLEKAWILEFYYYYLYA